MNGFMKRAVPMAVFTAGLVLSQSVGAKEIVIGVFASLTGPLAPLGEDMKRGYALAVKDGGPVNGDTVKLVYEDDQANAVTGLKAAQKLVQEDGAKVLVGGTSSAVVLAIAGQATRLNVPILTTNSQVVQTTGSSCSKYVFRTNRNDAMMAKGNATLIERTPALAKKKWFILYHDFVWGKSVKAEFEKIPGLTIVGSASRPMGTADWSSAISEIQASGADAIYLGIVIGNDMPAFVNQAKSFGLKQVMLPPLGMPDSMLQTLGDGGVGFTTGALLASWMLEDKIPAMAALNKSYYAEYKVAPGPEAIQAYVGMQWLLAGLKKSKSLETNAIIASLESTTVPTAIGDLAVRKEDHQGMVSTYISQAVKLPTPKYGSAYAWKVLDEVPWSTTKVDLKDTGCAGL
ncbi:ABC transporter substrate-binding protein [soil metagenome]